jgi:hypothetical protein
LSGHVFEEKMAEMPASLQFKAAKSRDYRIVAANGVWGGIAPGGDLRIDFFLDSSSLPEEMTYQVLETGQLGKEIQRIPQASLVTREYQVGVVMSLQSAEMVANWLLQKVKESKSTEAK